MHRNLAVLNSDSINRKRIKFTVGALEDAIFKNCIKGIPSLLGHDGLKPIGWNFPFALYMEPKLTRLIGEYQIVETNKDQSLVNKAYSATVARRYHEECEPHRAELESLIGSFQTDVGRYMGLGCAAYLDEDILYRAYPELLNRADSDGLFYLDDLSTDFQYLGQGIFRDKKTGLAIFCHQYFRRSLSHINNFHFEFLDRFMSMQGRTDLRLRIALDKNLIGFAASFHHREELEFAWGPRYSDQIEEIRTGVTHYRSDERQKLFSGVSGMQFWWKTDESQRILEAEELRDDPTEGASSDSYGCRYIHSIYDMANARFEHFDGAIRMYDMEGMMNRLDKEMNKAGKSSLYTKLFRVDGDLKLADWKTLITFYYQGNPLPYEYFGVKEEHEKLFSGDHPSMQKTVVEKYLPYKIEPNDGVRLYLSYHAPSRVSGKFDRIVISPDSVTLGAKRHDTVEFDTLEIKKALKRMGHQLKIPSHFKYILPHDNCINFPTILHSNVNLSSNLQATITAYLSIFQCLAERNPTVSLTLAWPVEDKEVRLSIFGKVQEVVGWIKANRDIPIEYPKFREWVENQSTWLGTNYEGNFEKHDLFDLISRDGVIFMHRKQVDPTWITFKQNKKGELMYQLKFPKDRDELFEAVKNGTLQAGVFYLVKKAVCSKTNQDYFTSDTSKLLDEGVSAVIAKVGTLGAFWTDSAKLLALRPKCP